MMDTNQYCILRILQKSEKPIWKKEIHRRINDHIDMLPIEKAFSIQTVGRRVNQLFNDNFIKAIAKSDDEVDRALITAYTLSEKGINRVKSCMRKILKRQVSKFTRTILFDSELDIDRDLLRHTFCDLHGIPKQQLNDTPAKALLSALQSYHTSKAASKHLSGEAGQEMIKAVKGSHDDLAYVVQQHRSQFRT